MYVKVAVAVPEAFVIEITALPAVPGGAINDIWVDPTVVNETIVPPTTTDVTAGRVPVIVTDAPPESGPLLGVTDEIVGGSITVHVHDVSMP